MLQLNSANLLPTTSIKPFIQFSDGIGTSESSNIQTNINNLPKYEAGSPGYLQNLLPKPSLTGSPSSFFQRGDNFGFFFGHQGQTFNPIPSFEKIFSDSDSHTNERPENQEPEAMVNQQMKTMGKLSEQNFYDTLYY